MKKIIMIGLALLLWGCGSQPEEIEKNEPTDNEQIATSAIYLIDGKLSKLPLRELYTLRLKAIQEGELEEVVIVQDAGDFGSEITVTDPDELKKLADYFNSIQLLGTLDSMRPPGYPADFKITLKGKEPLYIRIFGEEMLCGGFDCELMSSELDKDVINQVKGKYKKVAPVQLYETFMLVESWTDKQIQLPETYYFEEEKLNCIEGRWMKEKDPYEQVLALSHYIHEDFDSVADITDIKFLTAGLINQSVQYDCFSMGNNVCKDIETQDLLYFPEGLERIHHFVPDVYSLVPYSNVEKAGKSIFGDQYELPHFEAGDIAIHNLQSYLNFPEKSYFSYHLPYEYGVAEFQENYILDKQINGDEITYTLAIAHTGFRNDTQYVEGMNGKYYTYEYNDSVYEIVKAHAEDFEQWQYVLKKNEDEIQMISGHCIHRKTYELWTVHPDKEAYYLDENGHLKVNLASADASAFNEWVVNMKDIGYHYKPNIHEGLLSIWVSSENSYENFAVVFDMETGQTLQTNEVKEKLKIDMAKVEAAYLSMPEHEYASFKLPEVNSPGDFSIASIFINSKGKPALNFSGTIILFDWEEVR